VHSAASPKSAGGAGAGAKHSASGSAKPGRKPQSAPMVRKPTRSDQPSQSSALSFAFRRWSQIKQRCPFDRCGPRRRLVRAPAVAARLSEAQQSSRSSRRPLTAQEDGVIRMHLRGPAFESVRSIANLVEQLRDCEAGRAPPREAQTGVGLPATARRGLLAPTCTLCQPAGEMGYFIASVVVFTTLKRACQGTNTGAQ
uniref:Doublecortin domain-containing protein n=1 Tax=Macrostomum lignano TaxID=282301 RepID=A0A1I8FKI8_9PLAT